MRRYLRSHHGGIYFFTVVTHQRRPILTTELGRNSLRTAIHFVRKTLPINIVAIVLLPDHLHTVWELPREDDDYPTRWRLIKSHFSRNWLAGGGQEGSRNPSRIEKQERAIWQRRYYEHTCRDERDLKRFVDYVHVNPLKHGLVERVSDWPWSSFLRYVQMGEYPRDWGNANIWHGDEFHNAE
ncbi:REP-associated tyrosine transposase [Blastopirellula marina]|uniref:Transposase n=1 Tax=Blastopirellula marina TaxID=124 RepID=A0A2S8FI15_9BACT|nr:transposase [Blastopirellula marina]PQO31791.1 transposase [Blastopirellula marina]PTL43098.1 transposase [Blastopirellula marina]